MRKTRRRAPVRTTPKLGRHRAAPRQRRKRKSLALRVLPLALLALATELFAGLLLSPRLRVCGVRVEGNRVASTEALLDRANVPANFPMVRVNPAELESRLRTEPSIASARAERRWPNMLVLHVAERTAVWSVKAGGIWWDMDASGIAFRGGPNPGRGLPQIVLKQPMALHAGSELPAAMLDPVRTCFDWSRSHPDFRLARIVVDSGGHISLGSEGGMPVLLGSPIDLPKKLETLARLTAHFHEVRAGYDLAYVNLIAWDAPAIRPREIPVSQEPLL